MSTGSSTREVFLIVAGGGGSSFDVYVMYGQVNERGAV